ncbi:MAG: Abi family protein [Salinivirgaceae bacterium]|nr:Abi family protein [Salinivirgaceae bacterium]
MVSSFTKTATSIDSQIAIMRERHVEILNESKAREILLDIGYYRLGFYFFPFETTYPNLRYRTHEMRTNTRFDDAVALYYFDFDLRNILIRYISRIEVAFRTYITYTISNKYVGDPCWFVNKNIVSDDFANNFNDTCYIAIKKNASIRRHHFKYKNDKYAPAWKTLEYMTLGNMIVLFHNLKTLSDKRDISIHFGINQTAVFENYLESIRCIRNICAHGSVLYDTKLYHRIMRGPAGRISQNENERLGGAIKVIAYMLGKVSANRRHEMIVGLNEAYMKCINKNPQLQTIIEEASQLKWDLPNISQLEI